MQFYQTALGNCYGLKLTKCWLQFKKKFIVSLIIIFATLSFPIRTLKPIHTPYWRRGVVVSGVRRMNEVNARRARLVLRWVTVFGRVYHLGM